MKKLTTIILFCLLTLALTFSLVACGDKCDHTYDNACDATCNQCGEEREVGAHDFAAADCDTPKTCTACGITDGEALGHTPAEDDGDCTTPVTCSACMAVMVEGKENHHFIYELKDSSENTNVFEGKCEYCQDPIKNATTIIIECDSVSLAGLKSPNNEPVFLFTHPDKSYKMYDYKVDAGENEDAYISILFYTDETFEDFIGSKRGYSLFEGEVYISLNHQFIGIQIENSSNEPITITLSITPQNQAQS